MNSELRLAATIIAAVLFSLTINTTRFSPSPAFYSLAGASNRTPEFLPIDGAIGPESFAFDPLGGGPYTGVSDGRILKWHHHEHKWIDFAVTSRNRSGCEGEGNEEEREERCGRPLGLRFRQSNGHLYIADAYMGLLSVGPHGGLADKFPLALLPTGHPFDPFTFTNSLDIDQLSGAVYFTDSSSHYQRRNYVGAILSGDATGRLMKYDPQTKQITLLIGNLSFPNGVSLSKDSSFLLISETTKCRILKYWLKTPKAGTYQVLAELPGFPDNIKPSPRGGFWVGIHSAKQGFSKVTLSFPWVGKALVNLIPLDLIVRVHSWVGSGGLGIRLSDEGEVVEVIQGMKWKSVSEIDETEDGVVWIGSIKAPFAGKLKI